MKGMASRCQGSEVSHASRIFLQSALNSLYVCFIDVLRRFEGRGSTAGGQQGPEAHLVKVEGGVGWRRYLCVRWWSAKVPAGNASCDLMNYVVYRKTFAKSSGGTKGLSTGARC